MKVVTEQGKELGRGDILYTPKGEKVQYLTCIEPLDDKSSGRIVVIGQTGARCTYFPHALKVKFVK